MSKDTFYFSHDFNSRHDPKLITIQMEYQMEGIGIFWCLIEMLHEQGGYVRTEYERISYELRCNQDKIKWIIEESGLFEIEGEMFYSKSALSRINKRTEKSVKATESINKRWNDTNVLRTNNEGNTIKERKVKEIKEKKKRTVGIFVPPLIEDVKTYFKDNGYGEQVAEKFFNSYSVANWINSKGKPVLNWKQTAVNNWFNPENKSLAISTLPNHNPYCR